MYESNDEKGFRQIRMGDRLQYHIQAEEDLEKMPIPSKSLSVSQTYMHLFKQM